MLGGLVILLLLYMYFFGRVMRGGWGCTESECFLGGQGIYYIVIICINVIAESSLHFEYNIPRHGATSRPQMPPVALDECEL